MSKTIETALVPLRGDTQAALRHALRLWAEASTAPRPSGAGRYKAISRRSSPHSSPSSGNSRGRFPRSMLNHGVIGSPEACRTGAQGQHSLRARLLPLLLLRVGDEGAFVAGTDRE